MSVAVLPVTLAGCVALGLLSLVALPDAPAYDAWGWIVWGREVAGLQLDTAGGPSWKPLPVALTALFSLGGDAAAPELWLATARAGGLAALVLAFRVAARLAPGDAGQIASLVAGTVAAVALVLTPGEEARLLRHAVQGLSEPLLVALVLGAVDRHLAGRPGQAFALGVLAGLLRPEAWPFLVLYAWWLWRPQPGLRAALLTGGGAIVLLWLGGDLWGSGDPLTGAARARQPDVPLAEALSDAVGAVIAPVWPAAALTAAAAARRRERAVPALALAALGWMALVCAMALTLDYAATPRFFLPAAGLVCVLAGIGAGRLWAAWRRTPRRLAPAGVLLAGLAAGAPFAVDRVGALRDQRDVLMVRGAVQADLRAALAAAGRPAALRACGALATDQRGVALEAPVLMARELGVPLRAVDERLRGRPGIVAVRAERASAVALTHTRGARRLARAGLWRVYAVDCPPGGPR